MKIIFYGWEVGMNKISFIKLLNEKGGMSLSEAKKIKDRLVDGDEIVTIEVENDNLAKEILEAAIKFKVKAKLEIATTTIRRDKQNC